MIKKIMGGYGMRKRLLICGILIVVIAVGGVSYITVTNKIKKENALKIEQLNKQKADEKKAYDKKVADEKARAEAKAIEDAKAQSKSQAKDIEDAKVVAEKRVYIKMHEMINTKIVSKDGLKYGLQDITPTDCDELLKIVKNSNYDDKEKLTLFLNSWKKNDFSNGVIQHNYIWDKLGRGEGEAISLSH